MKAHLRGLPPTELSTEFLLKPRKYVKLEWEPVRRMLTLRMNIRPVQCFSLAGMGELQAVLDHLDAHPGSIDFFSLVSDVPGVFNFGGDLALFVLLARAKDVESLRMYGRKCLDLVWWMEGAAERGIYTLACVQGDALGGGLEAALPFHNVVAERSAQGGFPEVLFNLFPGMGAWDFVTRRASVRIAQQMIPSGKTYGAPELHELGLVDTVAEDGKGLATVAGIVDSVQPRLRGTLAALRVKSRLAAISRDLLDSTVDEWAAAALTLSDRDLRLMERLARAQLKKVGGDATGGAIDELKKMELEHARAGQAALATT